MLLDIEKIYYSYCIYFDTVDNYQPYLTLHHLNLNSISYQVTTSADEGSVTLHVTTRQATTLVYKKSIFYRKFYIDR